MGRPAKVHTLRGAIVVAALCAWAGVARAQAEPAAPDARLEPSGEVEARGPDAEPEDPDQPEGELPLTRVDNTMFQAGAGLFALPAAKVCPVVGGECEPAETAVVFSLDSLARLSTFGFGAGVEWGLGLRPTKVAGDPELERKHTRTYFLVEGQFRYYLPPLINWDWWIGASVGLVVINDSWTTLADREPYSDVDFVGPKATSLRTEGLSTALGIGGLWNFYDRFVFGAQFRYANWLLPRDREKAPLEGDQASFAGRLDVLQVGLLVGYVIPL